MKKQIFIVFCLLLLIIGSVCTPAMAARNLLSVPAYQQEQSNWCWAACSKSIIQYFKGASPTQSNIVKFVFGSVVNQGATASQTQSALANWNVTSSKLLSPLSYAAVQSQINNNHPIIAVLQIGTTLSGHDNLIRGYDTSYDGVLFIDPGDGDYHAQNYTDFSNGIHYNGVKYTWVNSIFDCY